MDQQLVLECIQHTVLCTNVLFLDLQSQKVISAKSFVAPGICSWCLWLMCLLFNDLWWWFICALWKSDWQEKVSTGDGRDVIVTLSEAKFYVSQTNCKGILQWFLHTPYPWLVWKSVSQMTPQTHHVIIMQKEKIVHQSKKKRKKSIHSTPYFSIDIKQMKILSPRARRVWIFRTFDLLAVWHVF